MFSKFRNKKEIKGEIAFVVAVFIVTLIVIFI